jgi:acyl carrier protein
MTSDTGRNIHFEVREIITSAINIDVNEILDTTKLVTLLDDNSVIYFWKEIERQFDIAVTRAQRASLPTVGSVVDYLKLRAKDGGESIG